MLMRLLLCCLSLPLVCGLCGCSGDDAGAAPPPKSRPSLVRVGHVTYEEVRPLTSAVGTIVAVRSSVVASGADGKVDQLLVREGEIVEEHQPLSVLNMVTTDLELDEARALLQEREQAFAEAQTSRPEEIDEAAAKMEAAEITMRIARDRFQRISQLTRGGAAAEDTYDEARERFEAAEQLYAAAKAAHRLVSSGPRLEARLQAQARRDAQKLHVEYLEAEKEKRTTRAPFRGIVVAEHTEAGQWLAKADPVVTVADLLDEVYVIANVDQADLRNIQLGASVDVEVDGVDPREWKGTVHSFIPRSKWETGSRTFPVKVSIKNRLAEVDGEQKPLLNEGMLARVRFYGPPKQALLVPKNSLVRSETGTRLYAVVPGEQPGTGKARLVMVEERRGYDDRVEVRALDLQPGEQVVTEGAERLTPFTDILIVDDAPASSPGTTAGGPAEDQTAGSDNPADAGTTSPAEGPPSD